VNDLVAGATARAEPEHQHDFSHVEFAVALLSQWVRPFERVRR
jgi:hypothetical protein